MCRIFLMSLMGVFCFVPSLLAESSPLFNINLKIDLNSTYENNLRSLFTAYDASGKELFSAGSMDVDFSRMQSRDSIEFYSKLEEADMQASRVAIVDKVSTKSFLIDRDALFLVSILKNDQGRNLLVSHQFDGESFLPIREIDSVGTPGAVMSSVGSNCSFCDRFVRIEGQCLALPGGVKWCPGRVNFYKVAGTVIYAFGRGEVYRYELESGKSSVFEFSEDERIIVTHALELNGDVLFTTIDGQVHVVSDSGVRSVMPDDMTDFGPSVIADGSSLAMRQGQWYSMIRFRNVLLLGHFPSGKLYEFDGQRLRVLPGVPPRPFKASSAVREAQSVALYGGDLYVGVWPWGRLYRVQPDRLGSTQVRLFSGPEMSENCSHPCFGDSRELVVRMSQRVRSIVPFGDALYVTATSKVGVGVDDERYRSQLGELWDEYGDVHKIQTVPSIVGRVKSAGTSDLLLSFRADEDGLEMWQGDQLIGRVNRKIDPKGKSIQSIILGHGVFGDSPTQIQCLSVQGSMVDGATQYYLKNKTSLKPLSLH